MVLTMTRLIFLLLVNIKQFIAVNAMLIWNLKMQNGIALPATKMFMNLLWEEIVKDAILNLHGL
jgi:hypothetical protein